jgi:colanic acid biosynthesis glycosyl transferase WcaI
MAVRGDAAEIIRRSSAGLVCEPENPQQLIAAIDRLLLLSNDQLMEMGRAGRNYYHDNLSLTAGVDQFLKLFEEMKMQRGGNC